MQNFSPLASKLRGETKVMDVLASGGFYIFQQDILQTIKNIFITNVLFFKLNILCILVKVTLFLPLSLFHLSHFFCSRINQLTCLSINISFNSLNKAKLKGLYIRLIKISFKKIGFHFGSK